MHLQSSFITSNRFGMILKHDSDRKSGYNQPGKNETWSETIERNNDVILKSSNFGSFLRVGRGDEATFHLTSFAHVKDDDVPTWRCGSTAFYR